MKILIDTQVFIWLINGDKRIGAKTHTLLQDASHTIHLSYFSLFEMKIKASIGKLTYDNSVVADLAKMGVVILMPTVEALEAYGVFNGDNKDPFDNALIATARSEKHLLVTSDPKILAISMSGIRVHDARK